MNSRLTSTMVLLGMLQLLPGAVAQEFDLTELRDQVGILADVVQEGLGLDTNPGFLGINSGRVEGLYLRGQGVVLEIRTPLANQRNRMSLSALASSLRHYSGQANPFEQLAMERAQAPQADSLERFSAQPVDALRSSIGEVRSNDYQSVVESALREASRGARLLRDIGAMDPDTLITTEQELSSLRNSLQDNLLQLRRLEGAPAGGSAPDGGDTQVADFTAAEQALNEIRDALEGISEQARVKAAELNARYEQAREEYRQRWERDVASLESRLFSVLCDYGMTLAALPADEHVSVVLLGLGEEADEALPTDRVHVIDAGDLLSCNVGEIDAAELQQRAASYDY